MNGETFEELVQRANTELKGDSHNAFKYSVNVMMNFVEKINNNAEKRDKFVTQQIDLLSSICNSQLNRIGELQTEIRNQTKRIEELETKQVDLLNFSYDSQTKRIENLQSEIKNQQTRIEELEKRFATN